VEKLLEEASLFHKNLGWVAMRQRDMDRAWHHAQLARYEAENLQGYVQEEMGHYEQAAVHYTEALALAQDLQHMEGEAKTRENLARLQLWLENFDASKAHWERARHYYEQAGNLNRIASLSVNQALSYNLAGRPEAALDPAEAALDLFVRLGEPWGEAVAAQNLAEAHLALGNLMAAEHFAERVVRLEEDHTLPDALRTLGEVKLAQGDLQDARSLVEAALESARSTQNFFLEAYAWRALGRVHLARGAPSAACEALHKAVALFDQLALPKQVDRTRALLPDAL
jgi:tetratricopeptide (TPR) repeat protein